MFVEIDSLLKVVVAGLVVGAGLPALFALGVRLAAGRAMPVEVGTPDGRFTSDGRTVRVERATRPRQVGAIVCFAVVVVAIAAGIAFVAGGGH
ncbi:MULTISPECIES: hypothetical protein [Cellulosimicrobium]|uniref:Uncharacterized protein n=1 Tax=Cellulosimicrobium cellulans TaxID=1710 RepID=A0AAV5P7P9_CELCE|nr:hypothetical protein [Cellulosimicrobium cellulans]QDP73919.1 hypothetical protein FOG94_01015 [Cellulosimicrobium cellulans]GLY57337.1 hypothetical protein Ccel01_19390 [Cellulosimicrobium cellulans]